MKINDITGQHLAQHRKRSKVEQNDSSFAQILNETQGKNQPSQAQASVSPGQTVFIPAELNAAPMETQQVLNRASNLLDLMDNFAEALGNPQKTLKSMDSLVRQIEKESQELKVSSEGQSQELMNLANEISVTAKVETLKFDRGDYI